MLRKFYKLHGIGNDYIYFDCMKEPLENVEKLAVRLSDRHFSIGGDGIILLCPSSVADCKMRMFNADGSEGKMCGNGIRCVGKLAHDLGYVSGDICRIETLSGIKTLNFKLDKNGKVASAKVDMGAAVLKADKIPCTLSGERIVGYPMTVGGKEYKVTLVSMGNPHCVTFVDDPYEIDLERVGVLFENNALFPERINTEFVRADKRNELTMRVWERGSGETWACGTGACAVAVAAVLNGFADKNTPVTVHLRGGDLTITYTDTTVFMEGGATLAFTGEVEI
ncbi:MAG: diaminopimelate epimerase [Clostridia bacterium]|nr:diaminopimelate epimerase [Clostridia bacterium]